MLGLDRRLTQLATDVATLEQENNEQMYAVVSLQLIESELSEIQQLLEKLNITAQTYQSLSSSATQQVQT